MSGDELVISLVGMAVAGVTWALWYAQPRQIRRLRVAQGGRLVLDLAPLLSAVLLLVVLKTLSAHDVRDDVRYVGLYFLLGLGWVGAAMTGISVTGISPRDDVSERGNGAAAWAIAGAMLGITACYAGGNIGDGPGWPVVVFSAALATLGLFGVWLLLEAMTGISETVTIDRDIAAGMRLGAFLFAAGLMLGRAVAGDWVSGQATTRDFVATAWPVLIVGVAAAVIDRLARPRLDHPVPDPFVYGVIPGLAYITAAVLLVLRLGLPA